MIAYKYEYKDRQVPGMISVLPAQSHHTEAIQMLAGQAYGIAPDVAADWFAAEQYHSRIRHFPEGQFVALEDATGRVVGMTSSMRFDYSPESTFVEDWDRTTGYG